MDRSNCGSTLGAGSRDSAYRESRQNWASVDFDIIGDLANVETIAVGRGIRGLARRLPQHDAAT